MVLYDDIGGKILKGEVVLRRQKISFGFRGSIVCCSSATTDNLLSTRLYIELTQRFCSQLLSQLCYPATYRPSSSSGHIKIIFHLFISELSRNCSTLKGNGIQSLMDEMILAGRFCISTYTWY